MKPIHFALPPVKSRKHRVLFDRDLPFRGRKEELKTQYRRQPKHRKQDHDGS